MNDKDFDAMALRIAEGMSFGAGQVILKNYLVQYAHRIRDAVLQEVAHTDHPMRHYDRTCPGCKQEVAASGEAVAWQHWNGRRWTECSWFVSHGFGDKLNDQCRELYLRPAAVPDPRIAELEAKIEAQEFLLEVANNKTTALQAKISELEIALRIKTEEHNCCAEDLRAANVHNILDDMGWICGAENCGSVKFNLLKSGKIECANCGNRFGVWEHKENWLGASEEEIYEETYRRNVMLATHNKELQATLDALIPEDHVVVPVEPTWEMCAAGYSYPETVSRHDLAHQRRVYKAMIAAAQTSKEKQG